MTGLVWMFFKVEWTQSGLGGCKLSSSKSGESSAEPWSSRRTGFSCPRIPLPSVGLVWEFRKFGLLPGFL
ncbi:hypothetical protein ATANTOWER_029749 [Ataeniobius toweri]|uniref:Uncharacterized protein n=1 Tax=Ataeniobius toweri TaxID=208326 RepID=A0ABU7AW93_9TELE|nr:hypothetical protein [Ataeniobius toweri]